MQTWGWEPEQKNFPQCLLMNSKQGKKDNTIPEDEEILPEDYDVEKGVWKMMRYKKEV